MLSLKIYLIGVKMYPRCEVEVDKSIEDKEDIRVEALGVD